jgi:tetratricopeptide (TPR) repeat protein
LSPIEQLAESSAKGVPIIVQRSSAYYLLTLDLLGRHPFFDGGDSDVVNAEERAWRRPEALPVLTLNRVMERRKALISDLPPNFQESAWTKLAKTLIDLDNPAEAREALEEALSMASPKFEFASLIARQWLRLGDTNRAIQILDASQKPYAPLYVEIAEDMLRRGASKSLISPVVAKAFVHASVALSGVPDFELERRIVNLAQKIRDGEVEKMRTAIVQQARVPGAFQPANLATAAAVSLDLGDHETARMLLAEGQRAFPRDEHAVVAFGTVAGPISYSTWHMGDRMRTALATQYYRLGFRSEFEELFGKISRDFRWEFWKQLSDESFAPDAVEPLLARVEPTQRGALMVRLSAREANRGEATKAEALLEALRDSTVEIRDTGALLEGARVALALGRLDIARQLFRQRVAALANETENIGYKAVRLSLAAAFLADLNKRSGR